MRPEIIGFEQVLILYILYGTSFFRETGSKQSTRKGWCTLISTLIFWLANILLPCIIIGAIEIYNDTNPPGWIWRKEGPWSETKFANPYWEEKMGLTVPFIKYMSRYHIVMFLMIVPAWLGISFTATSRALHYHVFAANGHPLMHALSGIALFVAAQIGVMGVEDFFYFAIQSAFNWYEPHALRKVLIDKNFKWFKDWLPPIFGLNIPGHWVAMPLGAVLLLIVRQYWIM
jgi:hypothetical protein